MIGYTLLFWFSMFVGAYVAYLCATRGSDAIKFVAGFLIVVIPGYLILRNFI